MRKLLVLTLALWLLPLASGWADCTCREPLKPDLPAVKSNAEEMEKGGKEVDAYIKKMRSYRDCLLQCVKSADNDLSAFVSGWNYTVDMFNAGKK
jgi:hypothetical protein